MTRVPAQQRLLVWHKQAFSPQLDFKEYPAFTVNVNPSSRPLVLATASVFFLARLGSLCLGQWIPDTPSVNQSMQRVQADYTVCCQVVHLEFAIFPVRMQRHHHHSQVELANTSEWIPVVGFNDLYLLFSLCVLEGQHLG